MAAYACSYHHVGKVVIRFLALMVLIPALLLTSHGYAQGYDTAKFSGMVTSTNLNLIGYASIKVLVEQVQSGPILPGDVLVELWSSGYPSGPWGTFDRDLKVGDKVEVYGKLKNGGVTLDGSTSYYAKRLESAGPLNEANVRIVMLDITLGNVLGYYKKQLELNPNQPDVIEAVRRIESGVTVTNSDQFERKIVGGTWRLTYKGTDTGIQNGMEVKLSTDAALTQANLEASVKPNEISVVPGQSGFVTYELKETNGVGATIASEPWEFVYPDGSKGPSGTDSEAIRIRALSVKTWDRWPYLWPEVGEKCRERGWDRVYLRYSFLGKDDRGNDISANIDLGIKPAADEASASASGELLKFRAIVAGEPTQHPPGTYKVAPAGMGNEFSMFGWVREVVQMPPGSPCHDWGKDWSITILYYGDQSPCHNQDLIEVAGLCGVSSEKDISLGPYLVVIPEKGGYIKMIQEANLGDEMP